MGNELNIPVNNPYMDASGAGAGFINAPMLSQYFESDYSIFDNPLYTNPIGTFNPLGTMGMGMGMGFPGYGFGMFSNPQYIDNMVDSYSRWNSGMADVRDEATNRQTQSYFVQQGNQFVRGSGQEQLNEQLTRLKGYIESNDMRQAGELYNSIYQTVSSLHGEEVDRNGNRISHDKAVRNHILAEYQKVCGTNMVADIKANGDGSFRSGWKEAWGNGQNSASDMVAFVTGESREITSGQKWNKWWGKTLGNIFGGFSEDDGKVTTKHVSSY